MFDNLIHSGSSPRMRGTRVESWKILGYNQKTKYRYSILVEQKTGIEKSKCP